MSVCLRVALFVLMITASRPQQLPAGMKTFDGAHSIDRIKVTVVYFLPKDREPLPDWQDRVSYFCRRVEQFHNREFDDQSVLKTEMKPQPFRSARTTRQLRDGDANFIFFRTLEEVDAALSLGTGSKDAFPILLVLSDINWRPLDDFYRVKPSGDGWQFEGQFINGRHFPGAESGGARATYLSGPGKGWGLVSADGWRVPYTGTDCVVYHEGVGHPIGLPHPEPGDGDVMSFAQYRGWISESWVNEAQKKRLGWTPPAQSFDRSKDLFSTFTAIPEPSAPEPQNKVQLNLRWPAGASVKGLRVRFQTELAGPWCDVVIPETKTAPDRIALGRFDRITPVSYRVDATLTDGREVELWGYFQVQQKGGPRPVPRETFEMPAVPLVGVVPEPVAEATELLPLIDVMRDRVAGDWTREGSSLISPKQFGARLELPYEPPAEYIQTVVVEPLDEPQGLILGQRLNGRRFAALVHYPAGGRQPLSALENVDGRNVGNATTAERAVLAKGRVSQIIVTVQKNSVMLTCDGRLLLEWEGDADSLSLSDYWKTPGDTALFLGAYDCRLKVHRVAVAPLAGTGRVLKP